VPLIFVTGISGAGKSTVCEELKSRGYEAYDSDVGGLSAWHEKETGRKLDIKVPHAEKTPDFRARHEYKVIRAKVEDLALRAKDRPVFLCGVFANENEVWDLFDKVIALTVDKDTLLHRIVNRTNNNFGKSEHERKEILGWHAENEAKYRKLGHITIDATRPLAQVTDDVLSIAKDNSRRNKVTITPPVPGR
jgi:dephospho-CoA kinase